MTALGTAPVGPRSAKPFPNALCRVQFYVQIGDIWPEETPSNPAGPSQCLPRGDLAGPHTPYFRACLLVGRRVYGDIFFSLGL